MFYNSNHKNAGLPYYDINWSDVDGQPFGIASYFNAIIFGDANNIVDTKGAMAVGGNFVSSRGLSLAYGNDGNLTGTGYSPEMVRFLVGGNVSMQGPLVVIGHVMAGGNFKAGRGSTYMIGKDGTDDQVQELTELYNAPGGSKYWSLSDRGTHYAVSSYDVPRFLPASRVEADVQGFFSDADDSITNYYNCIIGLEPNGTVTEHFHEWILRGNDPGQNIFVVDVRPNGILNREIRFEIPQGSLAIVIFRTGNHAHIQYGLWGDKGNVNNTLYVFEDADQIHMEVPAAIWGSILAPQAMFHAHPTGGNVNGNAALGAFEVNPGSGFEFHLYPFTGGVQCGAEQFPEFQPIRDEVENVPEELPEVKPEVPEEIEKPENTPIQLPEETPEELPEQENVPLQITPPPACPVCPPPIPCPLPTPCPEAPVCPLPAPCPEAPACPLPAPCPEAPACPLPAPCPEAPACPKPEPCPKAPPCPEVKPCPPCPKPEAGPVIIQPVPIPIPIPCPEQEECEVCRIKPGVIFGCIWGCECGGCHEWEVQLYKNCNDKRVLLYCIKISSCGCFNFEVSFEDYYILKITPIVYHTHRKHEKKKACHPLVTLKNVGVADLMIE